MNNILITHRRFDDFWPIFRSRNICRSIGFVLSVLLVGYLSRGEKPASKVRRGNDVMFHWRGRAKRHVPRCMTDRQSVKNEQQAL